MQKTLVSNQALYNFKYFNRIIKIVNLYIQQDCTCIDQMASKLLSLKLIVLNVYVSEFYAS